MGLSRRVKGACSRWASYCSARFRIEVERLKCRTMSMSRAESGEREEHEEKSVIERKVIILAC
jgi:hypothetical protein